MFAAAEALRTLLHVTTTSTIAADARGTLLRLVNMALLARPPG